jgi:peptidoglycan-N-acetylglucosamine deacetylase
MARVIEPTLEAREAARSRKCANVAKLLEVVRYVLAPTHERFADAIAVQRTLEPDAGTVAASAQRRSVALTFDDGPHPRGTPEILNILAKHQARATFFVVGEQVVQRPQLLVRMLDEGHAVGLHGFHHRLHLRRTPSEMEDDYTRGIAAIQDAVGANPTRHRPPYGIYSPWSLRIARERGLTPLLWSAWGKDWRRFTTPDRIAANATVRSRTPPIPPLEPLRDGDVVLLHDADFYSAGRSHERTAAALPKVLSTLKSGGFDTVVAV